MTWVSHPLKMENPAIFQNTEVMSYVFEILYILLHLLHNIPQFKKIKEENYHLLSP